MSRIFLHIGAPKTGTSTIQMILQRKRPDVLLPERFNASPCFRTLYNTRVSRPAEVTRFCDEFLDCAIAGEDGDIVASVEQFMGWAFIKGVFFPKVENLALLIGELRARGHRVDVLLVVREMAAFIESWYLFFVGTGQIGDDFATFLDREVVHSPTWAFVLYQFRRHGVEPVILPYEMMARDRAAFATELNAFFDGRARFEAEDLGTFRNKGITRDVYRINKCLAGIGDHKLAYEAARVIRAHFLPADHERRGPEEDERPRIMSPVLRSALERECAASDAAFLEAHMPARFRSYW